MAMWNRRTAAAWGTLLAIGGAVGATIGYGAYYRSDCYRRGIESELERFFGLPTMVGAIEPHSFTARGLTGVEIWLPRRRARVFGCPRVLWDAAGTGEADGTVLDIYDAAISIGSEQWEEEDYMRVLRASLQHNFQDLNIHQVRFHNARMDWPREDFRLTAGGVDGKVVFDDQGRGLAELTSHSLNGVTVTEPIRIAARIDPQSEDFLPEVTLVVPTLPLAALGLDRVLQSRVTQGTFAGRITLHQSPGGDEFHLAGLAEEVRLAELTRRLPGGPLPALVNVTIDDARIRDRRLAAVTFHGEVSELEIDALLGQLDWPGIGGTARVTVYKARLADGSIRSLSVAGEWGGGSLDKLTLALLGKTGIQGRLRIRVNALLIRNNKLISGDVELMADPPPGRTGTVDRALLAGLFEEYLGLPLPEALLALLPEQIEYVQLGARLVIDRQRLRVLSMDGPAGPAIITIRASERDFALPGHVDLSFPLAPILSRMQERIGRITSAWKERLATPSTTTPSRP